MLTLVHRIDLPLLFTAVAVLILACLLASQARVVVLLIDSSAWGQLGTVLVAPLHSLPDRLEQLARDIRRDRRPVVSFCGQHLGR